MQAVDLQPEEPATVTQHSAHVSLRERLLRFNVAVLRIVAAACAGLPDSKQASKLGSVRISVSCGTGLQYPVSAPVKTQRPHQ